MEGGIIVQKIVLTGGPCSGKTTVLRALKKEFGDKIVIVPEAATILLNGGFPLPRRDIEWSEEWQDSFQAAVSSLQRSLEDAYSLVAQKNGVRTLVCDRGILDGAAYTKGGLPEFCKRYNVDLKEAISRYAAVLHLQSLAVTDSEKYGKTGNEVRFESVERVQELESAILDAWTNHYLHLMIDGEKGIQGKISRVIQLIEEADWFALYGFKYKNLGQSWFERIKKWD